MAFSVRSHYAVGMGYKQFLRFAAIVTTLASPSLGNAANIATCGASEGYSYFPSIGLTKASKDSDKWEKDKISKGKFSITLSGDQFDVLTLDALGSIFSARSAGGTVIAAGKSKDSPTLLVFYPGQTIETYTVYRNAKGEAAAMWNSNKFGTLVPKVGAYFSKCSYLSF